MFCIAPRSAVSLPRSLGSKLMHVTRQKMNRLLVGGVSSFFGDVVSSDSQVVFLCQEDANIKNLKT